MAAGSIRQGFIPNHFEDRMMGFLGKLTRDRMKNRHLAGSDFKKVYICSPYAGNVKQNVEMAKRFCRYAIRRKCQPVASHLLYPQMLDDENDVQREMGLSFGLSLLAECSEVWVFLPPDGQPTPGMAMEIAYARRGKIPIIFINDPEAYGEKRWNPIESYDENHGKGDDYDGYEYGL